MPPRSRQRRMAGSPRYNIIGISDFLMNKYGAERWDSQELTGSVAPAINTALALGRNVATLTYAAYVAGANWANPSGQIARHTASSTATLRQNGIIAAGKTWQYPIVISNRTAGSVSVTGGDVSASTNGTTIVTITATGADVIITPTSDFDGDIDLAQGTIKQVNIAASTDFPGAELLINRRFTAWSGVAPADTPDGWTSILQDANNYLTENANGVQWIAVGGLVRADQNVNVNGKRYKREVDVFAFTNGKVLVQNGVSILLTLNSVGKTSVEYVASSVVNRLFTNTNPTDLVIRSDSLTEANPLNGDHTGVSLGQPGNGRIPVMITDDGATSYTDVGTAEFNSALDPTNFALSMFIQKDVWDATERYFLSYTVDSDNYIRMGGTSTAGQLVWEVKAGGTLEQVVLATGSPTSTIHVGLQVRNSVMKAIYNGVQTGGDQAVAGTFVGNFATMVHGAKNDTPNNVHLGKRAFNGHFRSGLSDSEWAQIARAGGAI